MAFATGRTLPDRASFEELARLDVSTIAEDVAEEVEAEAVTPTDSPITRALLGRALSNAEAAHQTIGKLVGLAVFASDALSSVAYATEEILLVLTLAGPAFFALSLPVASAIVGLLLILTLSYRQTIFQYPSGGGAYIVSRDNLGEFAAMTAGAALMTDYVLTVAVSVASGIAQVTSAFPSLKPVEVGLCLVAVAVMCLVNLRGVKESGRVFAGPTYFFLAMMALSLGAGLWRAATGTLMPIDGVTPIVPDVTGPLTLFLMLRAFASGCTALTGVEAISNGIPAFNAPKSRNAATTMLWMSVVLGATFLTITWLAIQVHAAPSTVETVISQVTRAALGVRSGQAGLSVSYVLYLLTAAATTAILVMAANTSFADFPRLGALMAADGFLPKQLTWRGHRLVFTWGIVALAAFASVLIVAFNGDVHLLIPLYAIGVFVSFTLSQAGMVMRWRQISTLEPGTERTVVAHGHETVIASDPQWRVKQAINVVGCLLTAIVTIVFAVAKFAEGAWIICLLLPSLVYAFHLVHRHYTAVRTSLSLAGVMPDVQTRPIETVVLVGDVHRGTINMIEYVRSQGRPWVAVHVEVDPDRTARVLERWHHYLPDAGELHVLHSPYRSLTAPVVHLVEAIQAHHPGAYVTVVMAQLIARHWWEQLLHQNSGPLFKYAFERKDRVAVVDVHYVT